MILHTFDGRKEDDDDDDDEDEEGEKKESVQTHFCDWTPNYRSFI